MHVELYRIIIESPRFGHGMVTFPQPAAKGTNSIIGVYGPGGAGKTAVIEAAGVLQRLLSGQPVLLETIRIEAEAHITDEQGELHKLIYKSDLSSGRFNEVLKHSVREKENEKWSYLTTLAEAGMNKNGISFISSTKIRLEYCEQGKTMETACQPILFSPDCIRQLKPGDPHAAVWSALSDFAQTRFFVWSERYRPDGRYLDPAAAGPLIHAVTGYGLERAEDGQLAQISRDGQRVPFDKTGAKFQSLVMILGLVAAVAGGNVFAAVDDLGSGLFEYSLGALLRSLQCGSGQLLFTSDNLYPLEALPPSNALFLTDDPQKRLRKIAVKKTNNLRDCYLRELSSSEISRNIQQALFPSQNMLET